MSTKWESLLNCADILKDLLVLYDPCSFAIADTEKFIYVYDGLGLHVKKGDAIKPGSTTHRCITERKPVTATFDNQDSLYGKDYTSVSLPVAGDNGQPTGCITWAVSTKHARLARMAHELSALSEQLYASSEEFTGHSGTLLTSNAELSSLVQQLHEQMSRIQKITGVIDEISSQTHLLGLNASIEAAHAGEKGVGFAVVAHEVRELAQQSKNSAKDINSQIQLIQKQVQEILQHTRSMNEVSKEQVNGASQLSLSIEAMTRIASSLSDISSDSK